MTQHDKRRAILHAALLGDALGAPFVGLKGAHILQLMDGIPVEGFLPEDAVLLPERPEKNTLPGLHSCLGQRLMAALAVAAPDEQQREPGARVGFHLTELAGDAEDQGFRWGALRQPGRPVRRAIRKWQAEYPWEERDFFAVEEPSEGASAALLGLVPVALALADPISESKRLARLSHTRLLGVSAPVSVALAADLLLKADAGKKLDAADLLRRLIPILRDFEAAYEKEQSRAWRDAGWGKPALRLADALEPLPSLLREQNDDLAVATLLRTCSDSSPDHQVGHVQHGFAGACVPWAFYRALGPMPPRLAIEDVLNRGGESSLVAGLTAALCVARHGPQCLPDEWWAGPLASPVLDRLLDEPTEENFNSWKGQELAWTDEEDERREPLREAIRKQQELDVERGVTAKKKKPQLPDQEDAPFAPPPHLWLKPGDEEDPAKKKILRAARGKKRIDWKDDRRKNERER